MRKIAAILLLIILLFNWIGYRFFSDFLQHRADARLEARIEKDDYRDDQLIEIRIPLNLPYQANWQSFERFDGEIDLQGVHYKYVKRKIYNDSLILLCLPNEAKQNIEKAKSDYFKIVNDIEGRSEKKSNQNNFSFKSIFSDFFINHAPRLIANYELLHTRYFIEESNLLPTFVGKTPDRPPEC